MRVWIDPIRLAARGVTAAEVLTAINASNFLAAPGKTENEYVAYSITMQSTLQTAEGFAALPLKSENGNVVRLGDVARVELGAESTDTIVSFNGKPGTFIGIFPTPAANPLDTAAAVDRGAAVDPGKPARRHDDQAGLRFDRDDQRLDRRSVQDDRRGGRASSSSSSCSSSARSARCVMPIVTIPLSLIGVCFLLLMMGYSINLLSLLAMVLAIGLVVDDAIVVVENIHRHIEEGLTPMQAAFTGMGEISSAVVAMTITLAAVFAPLAFTGGLTGALFREFALTLAGAVVISGLVALTITPMMSARLLKGGEPGRFAALRRPHLRADRRALRAAGLGIAEISSGDADDRRRADGGDGLHVRQDVERAGAGRGPGRAVLADQCAALCDQQIHRPLCRPDPRTDPGHSRGRPEFPDRRLRRRDQFRHRPLGVQGLVRTDALAEAASGRDPGADVEGGRRSGLRFRAAIAAGRRRRPADLDGDPVDRRSEPGLRGGRADQAGGAGVRAASSSSRTRWPTTRRR